MLLFLFSFVAIEIEDTACIKKATCSTTVIIVYSQMFSLFSYHFQVNIIVLIYPDMYDLTFNSSNVYFILYNVNYCRILYNTF